MVGYDFRNIPCARIIRLLNNTNYGGSVHRYRHGIGNRLTRSRRLRIAFTGSFVRFSVFGVCSC